ncbi:hypothetical protein MRX96_017495 [Rhipicephalus microplus]
MPIDLRSHCIDLSRHVEAVGRPTVIDGLLRLYARREDWRSWDDAASVSLLHAQQCMFLGCREAPSELDHLGLELGLLVFDFVEFALKAFHLLLVLLYERAVHQYVYVDAEDVFLSMQLDLHGPPGVLQSVVGVGVAEHGRRHGRNLKGVTRATQSPSGCGSAWNPATANTESPPPLERASMQLPRASSNKLILVPSCIWSVTFLFTAVARSEPARPTKFILETRIPLLWLLTFSICVT